MLRRVRIPRNVRRLALTTACVAGTLAAVGFAGSASADDSCREWKREHMSWMTEAVRRYLHGAPQAELDAAMFEILQREAYLTSCEISVTKGRKEMVGWRLVGRSPEEYGSAVLETVLSCAGFDLDLRAGFEAAAAQPITTRAPAQRPRRYGPRAR